MNKPNLYIFGDSWAKYPFPEGKHWTDLLKDQYTVYNFGYPGNSNEEIIKSFSNLPCYKNNDRVIVVWSEPFRIPRLYKHIFDAIEQSGEVVVKTDIGVSNDNGIQTKLRLLVDRYVLALRYGVTIEEGKFCFSHLRDTKSVIKKIISPSEFSQLDPFLNSQNLYGEIQYIKFFSNNLFNGFKPVNLTWDSTLFKEVTKEVNISNFYYIGEVSTLDEENLRERDLHPGIKGNFSIYNKIRHILENE